MIATSEMEEVKRYLPPKRELTPKINHTKTTITKSAPFLITKHHLDDTQMKHALQYENETIKDNRNRRYSYKGEVIYVENRTINTNVNSQPSSPSQKLQLKQTNIQIDDYYHKNYLIEEQKKVPIKEDNHKKQQMPYFKKSGVRETRSNSNIINRVPQLNTREQNSHKKSYLLAKQCQEYGLQEMHAARKKMQKQAKKLRKIHQQKVEKDKNEMEQSKIALLQNEIKMLKIKTLQSQKERYKSELQERLRLEQQIRQKITQSQTIKINRAKLILNKPKYKAKQTNDDTDSSFSSLQLS